MLTPEMMQMLLSGFGGQGGSVAGPNFLSMMFPNLQAMGGFQTMPHPLGSPTGATVGMPPKVTPPALAPLMPPRALNIFGRPIVGGATGDRSGLSRQAGGDKTGPGVRNGPEQRGHSGGVGF